MHKCSAIDIHNVSCFQAQPLFKDRRKFSSMVDPLLKGNYPTKGLHQALAVAAMCIQEEADTRPLISDVVTALDVLAKRHIQVGRQQRSKDSFFEHGECSWQNEPENSWGLHKRTMNEKAAANEVWESFYKIS